MTTYTSEAYVAIDGQIMWTYVFSDGERWVKMDEEYLAPDSKMRRRTRVFRQDFEGDVERRSTLKALKAKLYAASMTSHTVIKGSEALKSGETVLTIREAAPAPSSTDAP